MSKWQELGIGEKIVSILSEVPDAAPDHHLGHPFLTAYQIAIEFKRRHPEAAAELGLPVGGAGTGQRNSLAQYLALELSRNIDAGRLPDIEGGFLSSQHLLDFCFDNGGEEIHSSLTSAGLPLSTFRLRGQGSKGH